MKQEPETPSFKTGPENSAVPPPLLPSELPVLGATVSLPVDSPPPLPPKANRKAGSWRRLVAILLSLCLGLFLADGLVSLVDDSLVLFFGIHALTLLRGGVFFFGLLTAVVIYVLMGLAPMIPKRLFLPVTLFNPLAALVVIPFLIYFYGRSQQIGWVISLCQVILGLSILRLVQGGFKIRWPLVPEERLAARGFSWVNLSAFLLVNAFVFLPVVTAYLAFCAARAVEHFSEGFLALRPVGFTVQVRKYARSDGKTIQLVPMSHIGEPDFYRTLSASFPTNSLILMEGVTDNQNLLTNRITYKRMATSLGLAEQQKEFKPRPSNVVQADVDIGEFTPDTIGFLNLVMLLHSKGPRSDILMKLMEYSPPPHFEQQLLEDLLRKRNRHLVEEIQSHLPQSNNIIVPWGVAHMPGIAAQIQESGFRLQETREYVAIRFGSGRK